MRNRYRNILIGMGLLFSCGLVAGLRQAQPPAREVKSDTAVIRLVPTYTNTPAVMETATPAARLLLGTATALPSLPPPTPSVTPTVVVQPTATATELPPAPVAQPAPMPLAPILANGSSCDCSGERYNCSDFAHHAEAQGCFEYCVAQGAGDIHRLDRNNDGVVCEDR